MKSRGAEEIPHQECLCPRTPDVLHPCQGHILPRLVWGSNKKEPKRTSTQRRGLRVLIVPLLARKLSWVHGSPTAYGGKQKRALTVPKAPGSISDRGKHHEGIVIRHLRIPRLRAKSQHGFLDCRNLIQVTMVTKKTILINMYLYVYIFIWMYIPLW